MCNSKGSSKQPLAPQAQDSSQMGVTHETQQALGSGPVLAQERAI